MSEVWQGFGTRLDSGSNVLVNKNKKGDRIKITFDHRIRSNELTKGVLRQKKHTSIMKKGRLITEIRVSRPAAEALLDLLDAVLNP